MADRLFSIIHYHGELVGIAAIGALQYEIPDIFCQILRDPALNDVLERGNLIPHPDAPGARRFTCSQPSPALQVPGYTRPSIPCSAESAISLRVQAQG